MRGGAGSTPLAALGLDTYVAGTGSRTMVAEPMEVGKGVPRLMPVVGADVGLS